MALDITLEKDVLIPASENPDDHAFYWAVNLSYTSREGSGMVMSAQCFRSAFGSMTPVISSP